MLNDWQPTANLATLKQRAQILTATRHFFATRNILEVTTPVMSHYTVPDPYITSFCTMSHSHQDSPHYFLQTSPEFAMKRLLAAGSGPIYQIAPAFRVDECGRYHNAEFSLLEWYRPGFTHHQLMDEMDELLYQLLNLTPATRYSYQNLFQHYLDINPLTTTVKTLKDIAKKQGIELQPTMNLSDDITTWLQLLLTHCIEPQFTAGHSLFIYDFPRAQAALARIDPNDDQIAQRFEVYIGPIELANGFYELGDAVEQEQRFNHERKQRKQLGLKDVSIDHRLLQALAYGLPDCAGVALGFDRLVMLATHCDNIADVISFPFDRA